MTRSGSTDLSASIGANLPYLRRYARALTGSQTSGDRFATVTLETLLEDLAPLPRQRTRGWGCFASFTSSGPARAPRWANPKIAVRPVRSSIWRR